MNNARTTPKWIASSGPIAPVARNASSSRPVTADSSSRHQQREIRPHQVRRGGRRIARDLHPDQAGRADREQNPADRPEQHRQAEERIGRVMAENVGVERRYAGRGEAEQKPVEHAVMQVAPRLREPLAEIVAAMPLAAEIAQRQHVA